MQVLLLDHDDPDMRGARKAEQRLVTDPLLLLRICGITLDTLPQMLLE